MHNTTRLLGYGWTFTQISQGAEDGEWLRVANFPTTVHVELLPGHLGLIPDPVS